MKTLQNGEPNTLVLEHLDMRDLAASKDQKKTLLEMKAAHGLPAHAQAVADNGGAWLDGDAIFVSGQKLPRDGGWYITGRYRNGLRKARHSVIG